MFVALLVLAGLVALNVWATRRVLASGEDATRKKLFVAGVWVVPLLGALIVKDLGRGRREAAAQEPERGEPAPAEVRLPGGGSFDLQAHLSLANGVPLVDWEAARLASGTTSAEAEALACIRRAWLLHLRDALGPHFRVTESQDAVVLASLDSMTVPALSRYVSTTRKRVARVLDGVAHFEPGQKSVVVVFDDEDSYYHYVSTYYPAEGEFAFSGGMFIGGDCPHFVVKRGDLHAVEPVIAHELTHSALTHLKLPLWIDEGLAVNTEHRLTGVPRTVYTAQQLHGKHVAFWDAARIQEFWSGRSFQRTDDGNLLSYELARILVQEMSREWSRFASFVQEASREDAGHAAARRLLEIDLAQSVCALFDKEGPAGWAPDASTWQQARPA